MIMYHLNLTRVDGEPGDGLTHRTLATLVTEEPAVMAATLRAVADRLDPPQPVKPLYRGGVARCRGDACSEGHTYGPGCLLATRPQDVLVVVDASGDRMDAPDAVLSPAAAETVARVAADREAARRASAELRNLQAERRTRITPDGCGPEHTFTGSCALTPPHRD